MEEANRIKSQDEVAKTTEEEKMSGSSIVSSNSVLDKPRDIIVVIGSGRSGTSLTMQILQKLGMTLSSELLGELESNPLGHQEDAEIYFTHLALMKEFDLEHNLMLPKAFLQDARAFHAKEQLKHIVQKNIEKSQTIWGVKDPRISLFFPLWIQIFQELKLNPKYILCVRNPSHVVASAQNHYKWHEGYAELFWLVRNLYAIYYTRANVFVAHYEDWLSKPLEIAENIAKYTGLDKIFPYGQMPEISDCVHTDLNRSANSSYTLQNVLIAKLYKQLLVSRQEKFNTKNLLQVTEECLSYVTACRPWSENVVAKNSYIKKQAEEIKGYTHEIDMLKQELELLKQQCAKLD